MRGSRPTRRVRHAAHRGTAYILVLGITTMLVVFGIAGAMVSRVTVQQCKLQQDLTRARLAAEVALDVAHKRIDGSTSWRSTVGNGTWSGCENLADAKVYLKYVDEYDGTIAGDNTQPFRLYAKALINNAVRVYSVEFVPDETGHLTRRPRSMRQEAAE